MKNLKLPFLLLLAFCAISCDPPHHLYFINNSGTPAKVTIHLKPETESEESYYFRQEAEVAGDSIVYNLKPEDTARIDFGIGNWSDKELSKVAVALKSIQIQTPKKKVVYRSQPDIEELFRENRSGIFFKGKINIELNQ